MTRPRRKPSHRADAQVTTGYHSPVRNCNEDAQVWGVQDGCLTHPYILHRGSVEETGLVSVSSVSCAVGRQQSLEELS